MSEKIGLIKFAVFDLPSALELASMKGRDKIAQPKGKTLSLGESHPAQKPLPEYAPQLDTLPRDRAARLEAELNPLLDVYHRNIRDEAVRRDLIRRWQERQLQSERAQGRYEEKVDLFHIWLTQILFQRVYERVGRLSVIFRTIRERNLLDTKLFAHEHREQRLEDATLFPRLYQKALKNPFFEEIKLPNEFKALDLEQKRIDHNRRIRKEEDEILLELRRRYADDQIVQFFEKKRQDQNVFKTKGRGNLLNQRLRIEADYDEVWRNTALRFSEFREAVRSSILEQAEHFPKIFRKALVDIYEPDIKVPNDIGPFEKGRNHSDELRLVGTQKIEAKQEQSKTYMLVRVDAALEHNDQFAARNVKRDARQIYESERSVNKAQAAAQGLVYLAGREVPRVAVPIQIDLKTTRPLHLGVHGSPRAPETVIPVAPQDDAYFGATAGVRSLDGKLFEKLPEAAENEAVRHRIRERMQFLFGAQSYAAGLLEQDRIIDPTEHHFELLEKKRKKVSGVK